MSTLTPRRVLLPLGLAACLSLFGDLTLFAVLALYILGGEVIHDFAFAMLIGIVIGTYSSIFVASALVLEQAQWSESRR